MSKMKEFAALLGVEIGEEFQLADNDGVYAPVYRITEREVEYFNDSISRWIAYDLGINFVSDKRVIKKPWKPKTGEAYWCETYYGASEIIWGDRFFDFANYAVGNCFKTSKEAKAHKEEVLARLEKIYADGTPLIVADEI